MRLRLFDPTGHARPIRDVLGVAGTLALADGRRMEIDDHLAVTPETEIFCDAHGGDGGHGGSGGYGGRGARGSRGSSATQYSSAGDGGNGGDGGRGGAAADGSDPGGGGDVVFELDFRDTDLAVLTGCDVRAGRPGKAGRPGRGGPGGHGGSGGSGTSWTETYTTTENGQTVTKRRTESRPSGSDGRDGRTGPDNHEPAFDGREQPPGTMTFVVVDADGQPLGHYRQVYDLELLGFEICSGNVDGIYEPGEEILVTNLRLRNRAGENRLPTPPGSPVRISFKRNGYLETSGELVLNESLGPDEETSFAGPVVLKTRDLGDHEIPRVGDAWNADQAIEANAVLESVRHEFESFDTARSLHLRFPIEVTPISGPNSMAPGDRKRIFWRVRNVSRRDFGSRSASKRMIATSLHRDGGGLSEKELAFFAHDGSKANLASGAAHAIEHLPPYDATLETEVLVEGHISIGEEAEAYEEAQLRLDLSLGRLGEPSTLRRIQGRERTIRIARTYRRSSDSEILLVTNSRSTRDEVEAWHELVGSFGMRADVWDVAYNRRFDLSKQAPVRERLVEDFAGKTMIVLNNRFEVAAGLEARERIVNAAAFVDNTALLKAVAEEAVSFLFVGNEPEGAAPLITDLTLPVEPRETAGRETVWPSPEHFLRDLRARSRGNDGATPREVDVGVDTASFVRVEKRWYFFAFEPRSEHLASLARRMLERAERLFPTRRYRVTPRFSAKPGQRLWWTLWIIKEYDLGEIELTRYLDRVPRPAGGRVTGFDAGPAMHRREFVDSPGVLAAFFQSLDFKRKLELFSDLHSRACRGLTPDQRSRAGKVLVESIVADLDVEQEAVRACRGRRFFHAPAASAHGKPPVSGRRPPLHRHRTSG